MKWFSPMNRADSLFCRPKARTTRMPPKTSVVSLSISWRCLRTSRNSGRIRRFQSQVGVIDPGHQQECAQQQPPVDPGQDDQAAEELDHGRQGLIEHAENQLAHAAGILAQETRGAARLELVDPVQGQPHRVLVDLAPDRDLHALGRPRRQPAAPEPEHGAQDRDRR